MKRLEEIKNEYAKEFDYKDWTEFINDQPSWGIEGNMNDICKRYAEECVKASLNEASLNARIEPKGMMTRVDKESITDAENIVLL